MGHARAVSEPGRRACALPDGRQLTVRPVIADDAVGLVALFEGLGPDDRYLLFLRVPEPKQVKNRMHLCLRPTDRGRDEEVERILALGATMYDDRRDGDRGWAVLADPEGNEFCVLGRYRPQG